jgi:GMP synthase PP-ATPase subunit
MPTYNIRMHTYIHTCIHTSGVDIPMSALDEMVQGVQAVAGISKVVYDLTAKPPGTTEWE